MDPSQFDRLSRLFAGTRSRRHAAFVMAGSVLGGLFTVTELTSAAKGKKAPKKKKKKSGSDCVTAGNPCPAGCVANSTCDGCCENHYCNPGRTCSY